MKEYILSIDQGRPVFEQFSLIMMVTSVGVHAKEFSQFYPDQGGLNRTPWKCGQLQVKLLKKQWLNLT